MLSTPNNTIYEGEPPKTQNLFITNCVFILTHLNFSHSQSMLHLMQYTYEDLFAVLKTVELVDGDAF